MRMYFPTSGQTSSIFSACLAGAAIWLLSGLSYADEIDDFVRSEMERRNIPGLQLAVVRDNKIVKVSSYGLANIEDGIAVDDNTLFSINSITKAFAGVAVMQLVEQGKLDLSANISTYLPGLPAAWQKLNIRQLMSHTSGLPAILPRCVTTYHQKYPGSPADGPSSLRTSHWGVWA